jgi:hypothetical protein
MISNSIHLPANNKISLFFMVNKIPLCLYTIFSWSTVSCFAQGHLDHHPSSYASHTTGITDFWIQLTCWNEGFSLTFGLGWSQTAILLVSATWVAETIGASNHAWLVLFLMRDLSLQKLCLLEFMILILNIDFDAFVLHISVYFCGIVLPSM